MRVQIFDLDNCISNDIKRIPLIDMSKTGDERYEKYHQQCHKDRPANTHYINEIYDTIIFTARPEKYRPETERWLDKVAGIREVKALLMRPYGNILKSPDLKEFYLDQLFDQFDILQRDIVCAYDDRWDVIEMYNRNGVVSEILKIHNLTYK